MIRTRASQAETLLRLEARERRLAARMQRDRIARTKLQERITKLRLSLTREDAVLYEGMR